MVPSHCVVIGARHRAVVGYAFTMQSMRGTLFDRRVHSNDRRARSCRSLTRRFDGKGIAPLIFGLRLVFERRRVEPFQLAV